MVADVMPHSAAYVNWRAISIRCWLSRLALLVDCGACKRGYETKAALSQLSAELRSLPVCYREGDRALILASDGVWDRLPEADCSAIVESTLGTPSDQARPADYPGVTVVPWICIMHVHDML